MCMYDLVHEHVGTFLLYMCTYCRQMGRQEVTGQERDNMYSGVAGCKKQKGVAVYTG
jgi:hypothetical protein